MGPKIEAIIWFLEHGGQGGADHQPGEYRAGAGRRDRHLDRALSRASRPRKEVYGGAMLYLQLQILRQDLPL